MISSIWCVSYDIFLDTIFEKCSYWTIWTDLTIIFRTSNKFEYHFSNIERTRKCTTMGNWTLGCDQNLREMSMNVNSRFIIFKNREICECQFSIFFVILSEKFAIFFVILSEKFAIFFVISHKIDKITRIEREWDFTI